MKGAKGVGLEAHRPARTADASSQGNSKSTRPARASLETPFSNSFRGQRKAENYLKLLYLHKGSTVMSWIRLEEF